MLVPPSIHVESLVRLPGDGPGFLELERRRCVLRSPAGELGDTFIYDHVLRQNLDAVVIVAHYQREGVSWIYLRSCVRPPLAFREEGSGERSTPSAANQWELPAGLIETPGELEAAARRCAARELCEEVGFEAAPEAFQPLGAAVYPSPGVIAERQLFLVVEVDPSRRRAPSGDGSELERTGEVLAVPLEAALTACRDGHLQDSKTELGLRRFHDSPWASRR